MRKRERPAQSTVVGAMFFIILLFFSLGIFYYLQQNYTQYGTATQKAWELQQQRMNQKFSVSEAFAVPVNSGYKVLFNIVNEGAVPIDIVNVYLYNTVTNSVSLYKVSIPLNPGQTQMVNLTKYNATFPSALNGDYKVSMWTSLGVGSSTVVALTIPTASSSAEGNVYPVAGTLGSQASVIARVKGSTKNGYITLNISFTLVNNNLVPVNVAPCTSIYLQWIPTPSQLQNTNISKSVYIHSGTIGSALEMGGKPIVIPPGGTAQIKFINYSVAWVSSKGTGVTHYADLYILNNAPTSSTYYLFSIKILLDYKLVGYNYNYTLDINCGYANVTVA